MNKTIQVEVCGCCEALLTKDNKNGLSVDIKYSEGGWGQSKTLFSNNSDEICDDCYVAFMDDLNTFTSLWDIRRGENRPKEIKL